MAHEQPPEPAEPRDRAFNDPAVTIPAEPAMILVPTMHTIGAIGRDQSNPLCGEALALGIAVVRHVRHQGRQLRQGTPTRRAGDADGLQGRRDERDFPRAGRGDMYSQRKTLAVDHHHAL
jgi:hypothetical protein